jgi:RhoGEF domain
MLDILDEKGILSSEPLNDCGYIVDSNATITMSSHSSSRDVLVTHGPASPILIKHIVENFVDGERQYIRYLKNLRCFLVEIGLPYDVHMIYSNLKKILILQSQLLVHFERIYAKPEALQNWGYLFNLFQSCFEVYVPFTVGLRSSVELAKQNFRTFGVTDGGPEFRTLTERRSNLESLLLKPFKQLAKYRSFLQVSIYLLHKPGCLSHNCRKFTSVQSWS